MSRPLILISFFISITLYLAWGFCNLPRAGATGGAFPYTKHGGGTVDGISFPGVDRIRSGDPLLGGYYYQDVPGEAGRYLPGECTHCHEPHSSFGGGEPPPTSSEAQPYLLFNYPSSPQGAYAELCWYCHEGMTLGSPLRPQGYGYWGFYQGKTIYQNSSHYTSSNFYWSGPYSGPDPVDIWPRKSRSSLPVGNKGSCLNCHTPHGIKEKSGDEFDTGAVPLSPVNLHLAANNLSVSEDYVIPRQLIAWEEGLCYACHDADGPSTNNIAGEINKRNIGGSGHPVDDTSLAGRHVVSESFPITGKHVECYDCHNPHVVKPTSRVEGLRYVDIGGTARDPSLLADPQPYIYEICLKCHGDGYANFIPTKAYTGGGANPNHSNHPLRTSTGNPASSNTHGSNKRLEFNPSSTGSQSSCGAYPASDCNPSTSQNTAYHPVADVGRNTSAALQRQLLAGLTPLKTIMCTDCHNNEATGSTPGPVTESNLRATDVSSGYAGVSPVGPHGSKPALVGSYQTHRILRANYNTTLGGAAEPFSSYNSSNFALCFLCHNEEAFTTQCGDEGASDPDGTTDDAICTDWATNGPKTNFYSTLYDVNLHASHIVKKPVLATSGSYTACANCHYNVHSNIEAANTMYADNTDANWNRTNDGSRLINFSPIVSPSSLWTYSRPFWGCVNWLGEKRKGCSFNCHGFDQELFYTPANINDSCP